MAHGNPEKGLLRAIIKEVRKFGPDASFRSFDVMQALDRKGYWDDTRAQTPERTVNMYCSQNPHIFAHAGPDSYRVRRNYLEG